MEDLNLRHVARQRAGGTKKMAIIGVVASGNLEVLVERIRRMPNARCKSRPLPLALAKCGMPSSSILSSVIHQAVSSSPSMTAVRDRTPCRFAWRRRFD